MACATSGRHALQLFLGLPDTGAGRVSTWKDSDYGSKAIISLASSTGFYCNRKLIGAKNLIRPD
uniref:Uncharacterized protein n=1 Tax=Oryza glumipatula TaxID=40148 RepID=A0A0E0AU47_9ORYZ